MKGTFTGLIEALGTIERVQRVGQGRKLVIAAPLIAGGVAIGDSVAVNGVCLTVVQANSSRLIVEVVPETVRRSTISQLQPGTSVNLERAMRADARFGGHIVAGHVDGMGTVAHIGREDNAVLLTVNVVSELIRYVVAKGSIAIDGVSLTVMDVGRASFRVSVIPHTAAETTLHQIKVGNKVNLELDQLGKYVDNLLGGSAPLRREAGITVAKLKEWGY